MEEAVGIWMEGAWVKGQVTLQCGFQDFVVFYVYIII